LKTAGVRPGLFCFRREESSRFLKKAAQKLLLCWVMGIIADAAHDPA
jgi:hypothetical protein